MQKEEVIKEEYLEEEERRRKYEEAKKKESKVTIPEKEEKRLEMIPLKKEEEHVAVPLIKLERFSELELEKLELSKEITKIGKERRAVSVPIVELQEPSSMLKEYELNYKIPRIEKTKRLLTIPIIRVKPYPKPSVLLTEFDTEIRKPTEITLPKIRVPIYRKTILASSKLLLENFDLTIDERLKERLEKKEEVERELPVKEVEVGKPEIETLFPATEEEIPDFLELTFGGEGGRIRVKGPKIILLKDFEDDSHISFLETLYARIYREKEGGEPEAVKILKIDEMSKREIEKWLKPSHKIFTINLDYKEDGRSPWLEIDEDRLWERLSETTLGEIGFIIFITRDEGTFNYYTDMLEKINQKAQLGLDIIRLTSKKLPYELAGLASGINVPSMKLITMTIEKIPVLTTFDSVFNVSQRKFKQILEEIMNEEEGLFKRATNRNKGQIEGKKPESDLHYMIKVFLVRMKTHELRKRGMSLKTLDEIRRYIKTEEGVSSPVPDVQIDLDSEVYEVETLFGEGEFADIKIDETIRKYDQTNIQKVNVVMDNLGFLMHLKNLAEIKLHFKDRKPEVEFYTLDLQNKKLISFVDIKKKLKELKGKMEI